MISRFDVLVPLVLVGLAALTVLIVLVPSAPFVAVLPEADHIIDSASTLAAGGVAALAWIRYAQTRQLDSLFQAAAFLTLFAGGAMSLTLLVSGLADVTGFDRLQPGQGPVYMWTVHRFMAAVLLLVGASAAVTRVKIASDLTARLIVLAAGVLAVALGIVVLLYQDRLPVLVPADQLARFGAPDELRETAAISIPLAATQLIVAALFLAAAAAYARLFRHSAGGRPYLGYLAAGLAIAAFSQLHFAVVPGNYQDLVTGGDILRATFYGLVLAAVASASRGDLVELRRANTTLTELRESDAQRVALEERARLAREIHDGLVQDLWLARLTHGRLVQVPDLPHEAREVATRVDSILEEALAEARQAIVAMQPQSDGSFGNLLVRFVEDYGDRFGLEVDCTVEGEPVQLSGRAQAEVLRICREALNNARKHADATLVRVALSTTDSTLLLRITDNGRGFDPAHDRPSGFGLQSMRDRAQALDAGLAIESAPMAGTQVTLTLDMAAARAEDGRTE